MAGLKMMNKGRGGRLEKKKKSGWKRLQEETVIPAYDDEDLLDKLLI